MKKFKLIDNSYHFFSIINDAISKPISLSFKTHEYLYILSDVAKKIMKMFTNINGKLSISASGKMNKKGGNILYASTFHINTNPSKISKPNIKINYNFIIYFLIYSIRKLSMNQNSFLTIVANGIVTILRPFGGLDDNPNYDPDGIDNLTFSEIDEWTFLQCDRINKNN